MEAPRCQKMASRERRLRDIFRKAVYGALVDAESQGIAAAQARASIAKWFGVPEAQVRDMEQEGLYHRWPRP